MTKYKLLTFHFAHNYGAVLQAFALKYYLKKNISIDVEVEDYKPKVIKSKYSLNPLMNKTPFKKLVKFILRPIATFRRHNSFDGFIRSYLNPRPPIEVVGRGTIVGSDQIWNHSLLGCFDAKYFGIDARVGQTNTNRCISYAASAENLDCLNNHLPQFNSMLKNVDKISVREDSLADFIVTRTSNYDVQVVLDPTLLLTAEEWSSEFDLSYHNKKQKDNYLLLYQNNRDPKAEEIAKKIAKRDGLELIEVTTNVRAFSDKNVLDAAGPLEFLSLVKHAKFVVTTSYHGLAFALVFEKQFYSIDAANIVNNRVLSLLTALDLNVRSINNANEIDTDHEIDFSRVSKKIGVLRSQSHNFLNSALV